MREHIKNKCNGCNGGGYKWYSDTTTWHKDILIGGCAMTQDICDDCWGSGDADNPWEDLYKLKMNRHETALRTEKLVKLINKRSPKKKKGTK